VAATASVLMRAYRAADGSYHTWRAGGYDPDMSDAVGDQAPPFPIVDYSDHVVIGFLEGPLARSDANSFEIIGTLASPVTFPTSGVFNIPGTDCRDYDSISCWVVVTAAPTTPAVVSLTSAWTNVDSGGASGPEHLGVQRSDDAISSGISPQNQYQADFEVNAITAASGAALGPYNVPVRGRNHILIVKSDTNDVEGYVVAMRLA